uniref:Uncharacterized protein n=1 Tax=Arundo donax TaxID=35708 RepID=A0A0A9BTX9_ARUDO
MNHQRTETQQNYLDEIRVPPFHSKRSNPTYIESQHPERHEEKQERIAGSLI